MIPLRDENPSGSTPLVTRALIVVNCLAFVYEVSLGPRLRSFLFEWGLVPERLTLALRQGEEPLVLPLATLVSSTFLHGGWLHLLGNMWYLWIFGDNIEDRLGKLRFIVFYVVSGAAAGWIHVLTDPSSRFPTVGASGAIAAVLGAYAVTYPKARVITLIPLFFYFEIVAMPALIMLVLWFAFQFLSGLLAAGWTSGAARSNVAWWAHIGGFAVGALLIKALGRRKHRRTRPQD